MGKISNAIGEAISHQAVIEFLDYKKGKTSSNSKTGISALTSNALKGVNRVKSSMGMNTKGIEDGVIHVQYNPSSINFTASSKEKTGSQQEGDYMVTTVSAACTLTMSVELIFRGERMQDEDIKPKMDLFFSMMKQNWGRRICFSWANIRFEGIASSVEVNYDMFDRKGNPVSSKVKLQIQGKTDDKLLKKSYEKMESERKNVEEKQEIEVGQAIS